MKDFIKEVNKADLFLIMFMIFMTVATCIQLNSLSRINKNLKNFEKTLSAQEEVIEQQERIIKEFDFEGYTQYKIQQEIDKATEEVTEEEN